MRQVSYDLTLGQTLTMASGRQMTALEIQWEHLELARKYAEDVGLVTVGGDDVGKEILRRWEEVLAGLEADPMSLANRLDWVAKYRMVSGYRERHGLGWKDPKLLAMDLQYHDVRPETLALLESRHGEAVAAGSRGACHDGAADDDESVFQGAVPAALAAGDSRR